MAEAFVEREAVSKERAAVSKKELPKIERRQAELHSPLDSMARAAAHFRMHSETTHASTGEAGLHLRILSNVQEHLPEGSAPLITRFTRMLNTL